MKSFLRVFQIVFQINVLPHVIIYVLSSCFILGFAPRKCAMRYLEHIWHSIKEYKQRNIKCYCLLTLSSVVIVTEIDWIYRTWMSKTLIDHQMNIMPMRDSYEFHSQVFESTLPLSLSIYISPTGKPRATKHTENHRT